MQYLGTLKGVSLKSSLDNNNQPVHVLNVKIELSQGHERVQDITEHLKEVVQVDFTPRQPTL